MLTTRTWRRFAAVLAVIFVAANTANALNKGGDALVYFEGGRRFLRGLSLYEGSGAADGFIGPPFQAVFFAPFAAIAATNLIAARLLWYTINLAGLALGIKLTLSAWSATRARLGLPCGPWLPALFAPLAAVLLPLQTNFEHQNMNALLLAILAGATWHLTLGSAVVAGVLVGTATALKAFPALLIVYLAARRWWTACVTAVLTAIGLTVVPVFVYGVAGFCELLGTWLRLGSSGWPIRGNNQSLVAALDRLILFMGGAFDASGVRTAAEAPLATTLFVSIAIVLVGAAVAVLVAIRRQQAVPCELAAMTVLAILLAPIAWDHYWTLMFPAFFILHDGGDSRLFGRSGQLAFWIAAILTTGVSPLMLGRSGFDLARQLSANTMAALVLYAALVMTCRRISTAGNSQPILSSP